MAKILIAEDDKPLGEMVAQSMQQQQHVVDLVLDGKDAIAMLETYSYDLAILDWSMPGMTGIDICSQFRAQGGQTPILMLTGKDQIDDKVLGFGAGADDYLTKPFDHRELVVRVNALLRRKPDRPTDVLVAGCVKVDPVTHSVTVDDKTVQMTPREFGLLEFFLRHPGQVFSADALLDRVWDSNSDASHDSVRVLINRLRNKLSCETPGPEIKTIFGVGYKLEMPSSSRPEAQAKAENSNSQS